MYKKYLVLLGVTLLFLSSCSNTKTSVGNVQIEYLGQAAGFKIVSSQKVIYVDPYKLPDLVEQKADQIYITHSHFDSCSPQDIAKITGTQTLLIGPQDCIEKVKDIQFAKVSVLDPGYTYNMDGITVDTIRAYNVNATFHPFANAWMGYVWQLDDKRIYYSGFTDYVQEMDVVQNADVAILIINDIDSLKSSDATAFVKKNKPKEVLVVGYSTTSEAVEIGGFIEECDCDAKRVNG